MVAGYTIESAEDRFANIRESMEQRFAAMGFKVGQRVLSVGFRDLKGLAVLADAVGSHGHVTGIDISAKAIARARAELDSDPIPNVTVSRGSVLTIPFEDDAFDLVLCKGMLHEVRDLDRAIEEMARVCALDGSIVVIDFQRFSRACFLRYQLRTWFRRKPLDDVWPGFSRKQLRRLVSRSPVQEIEYRTLDGVWRMGPCKSGAFLLALRPS